MISWIILFLVFVVGVSSEVGTQNSEVYKAPHRSEESSAGTPAQGWETVDSEDVSSRNEWKSDAFYEDKWKNYFPNVYPVFLEFIKQISETDKQNVRRLIDFLNRKIDWDFVERYYRSAIGLADRYFSSAIEEIATGGTAHHVEKRKDVEVKPLGLEATSTMVPDVSFLPENRDVSHDSVEQVFEAYKGALSHEDASSSLTERFTTVYDTNPTDDYSTLNEDVIGRMQLSSSTGDVDQDAVTESNTMYDAVLESKLDLANVIHRSGLIEEHPETRLRGTSSITHLGTWKENSSEGCDKDKWKIYIPEMYSIFTKARSKMTDEGKKRVFWGGFNSKFIRFIEEIHSLLTSLSNKDTAVTSSIDPYHGEATDATVVVSQDVETDPATETESAYLANTVGDGLYPTGATDAAYHTIPTEDETDPATETGSLYLANTVGPNPTEVINAAYHTIPTEVEVTSAGDKSDVYLPSTTEAETKDVYQDAVTDPELDGMASYITSESGLNSDNGIRRSGLVDEHLKTTTAGTFSPNNEGTPVDGSCEGCSLQVGSIRGTPGVHFPNYSGIPITSFSCADKHIPGLYADLDTGCQVFHVCWSHQRESFLCPVGLTFNQAILACDYWYSSNCSLAPFFFDVNPFASEAETTTSQPKVLASESPSTTTEESITQRPYEIYLPKERPLTEHDRVRIAKFLPNKSKVKVYSEGARSSEPTSQWVVKQNLKQDISPMAEELSRLPEIITKAVERFIAEKKLEVLKSQAERLSKLKPAATLKPCKVKETTVKPQISKPPPVKKPLPLAKLNPRFIIKPVSVKKPVVEVNQKPKIVAPKVPLKQAKSLILSKVKAALKPTKDHSTETVMEALKMAGSVFQREILPMTKALIENYAKFSKSKH